MPNIFLKNIDVEFLETLQYIKYLDYDIISTINKDNIDLYESVHLVKTRTYINNTE